MHGKLTFQALAIGVAALALAPVGAQAQAYPPGDIHFICGYAAGSGADVVVRFVADKLRPVIGRNIIVENRPGAIGNIATEYVSRSKPDGLTILVTGANSVAGAAHLFKNPTYEAAKAFQIAATINRATMMVGVRKDSPYNNAKELAAAMKAKGEKASWAYANPTAKVLGALYREKAGLQSVDVAYRTGAEFLNDLASGAIDYAIPDNVQAMARLRAGDMKILGVGAGERMKSAPDIPTLTEQGFPMDVRTWWAALVPSATPKPIVDQINAWFAQVVDTPEARAFSATIASDPWVTTPAEAQAYFIKDIARWGEYVKIAKIEPQG
ncbi:MAG TPA: tripartite tricarboxylate transporter substrate binding protein [Xanthobacteraceae bacterium]|nr:tripartite tricarboxylate transporter substrate binding protein [Xanthobacteraceae bacterium]